GSYWSGSPSVTAMSTRQAAGGAAMMPTHQCSRAFAQMVACTSRLVADSSSETFFPHWVWDNLARELHGSEAKYGTEEIVRRMTLVGLWCIQMNPESRPSMSSVIEMLERSMGELEMPPRPFLFSPVHSTTASSYASVLVMMSSP
ncbi:hypothetical protein CFC21_039415, partial [Triticum aestivum]